MSSITKIHAVANPRIASFKKLLDNDIKILTGMCSRHLLHTDANTDAIVKYNTDWLQQIVGNTPLVLFPETTEQVAAMMKYCHSESIAVVPQGGNTGLVYGSVPLHDEVIMSTLHMTKPMDAHPETFSTTVGAGVVLQCIQEEANKHGLLFPLDMGSKGSAQIGGCISTNAGGIHFSRYGSIRSNVIGLEAVTATGDVISTMTRYAAGGLDNYSERSSRHLRAVRKDNVGYDLKQLFIGSEGTLGIVTKAEVQLHPAPASNQVLMLHLRTIADVLALFRLAKAFLGNGLLSAFEVMDTTGMYHSFFSTGESPASFLIGGISEASHTTPGFVVLLETQGADAKGDEERVMNFIQLLNSGGEEELVLHKCGFTGSDCIIDQVMAVNETQLRQMWNYRENIPVNLARAGVILKCDVCFPFDKFYYSVDYGRQEVVKDLLGLDIDRLSTSTEKEKVEAFLREEVIVTGYGHFGDGNVHLNIVDITKEKRHANYLLQTLAPRIYEWCAGDEGSISAEHGIGLQKKKYLKMSRSDEWYSVMKGIKHVFDPRGILNPYKMFK